MSQEFSSSKNKHQKHPKVQFEQYLYDPGEPLESTRGLSLSEIQADLLEDSFFIKRRFRNIAERSRS